MAPTKIFGAANIGDKFTEKKDVEALLSTLKKIGIGRIDTASRYPPTSPGSSERLLGEAHAQRLGFDVDTKIKFLGADPSGSLGASAIEESLHDSFERLGIEKVNTLYCHAADPTTPLIEQANAFDEQYRRGRFNKLGISNFPVPMIEELLEICTTHGFVKPSVYQGQYNLLCRRSETDLIPLLRRNNISFVAFSPLGGGFLTGRFSKGIIENTRFAGDGPFATAAKRWYDKPRMHSAILKLDEVVSKHNITLAEAALRWLFHHSILGEEDGVILGASRCAQIEQNMVEIERGPLPEEVVDALKGSWAEVGVQEIAP